MIRRHALAFRTTLMLADGGLAICLALLLSVLRFGRQEALPTLRSSLPDTRAVVFFFAVSWVAALWMNGLYRSRARWTFRSEVGDILRATATFAVATLAFLYIFKLPDVSRLLLLYLFPSLAAMALVTRMCLRILLAKLRESAFGTEAVAGGGIRLGTRKAFRSLLVGAAGLVATSSATDPCRCCPLVG